MNFAKKCAQYIGYDVEIVNQNHFIEGRLIGANANLLFVQTQSPGYAPEPKIAHVLNSSIGYVRILAE
ncbi:hypothetical protein ACHHV8_14920 [Paenibacillus sp. TAB 01]|uniref:hypothetical protein n=1 Tax=Paenibacillus sp. TAB 01 TaxID=3368988 RepID=UPI003751C468